jgi:hypothetical protein
MAVDGASCVAIGKALGRPHQSVSKILRKMGVESGAGARAALTKANEAGVLFSEARSKEMISKLAGHVEAILEREPGTVLPKELRDLAVTGGILVDKQRLIEGQSTANVSQQVRVWGRKELPGTPEGT